MEDVSTTMGSQEKGGALELTRFWAHPVRTVLECLAAIRLWWWWWGRRFSWHGASPDSKMPARVSPDKAEFLEEYGLAYGYPGVDAVSFDELRSKEFARLRGAVYLDHAGAALYTESQVKATLADLSANLYGNPHSQSESSTLSSAAIESARNQVLAMCHTSAEEYACVFTSGATAALKLVGELFPWSGDSQYMYTIENHNSVLGIREYALNRGAAVVPVYVDGSYREKAPGGAAAGGAAQVPNFRIRQSNIQKRTVMVVKEDMRPDEEEYNLFAFPSECNFSGVRFDLGLVPFVQQASHVKPKRGNWLVLLDAAKGCSTAPPNLSRFPADFVAMSFYKIFGYPTGLGALLIRKDAAKLMKKQYFGGGTVSVAIADDDFVQRRSRAEQQLEHGTVSFLDIASLRRGFSVIDHLQMAAISRHTGSLTRYTVSKLSHLKHWNGASVCVLYGNHNLSGRDDVKYWGSSSQQGPTISFNLKGADGSWIGSREVEKLATLSGIHLRTGCFCNPGACAKYLGLSNYAMKQNFEAGHVCWDDKDLINGSPTGAVRVSFGYMNTFEDCKAFLQFISKFFVDSNSPVNADRRGHDESRPVLRQLTSSSGETKGPLCSLQSITVYPIKSCGGFKSRSWPLGDSGLLYDREWLLVSLSGEVLTQKKEAEEPGDEFLFSLSGTTGFRFTLQVMLNCIPDPNIYFYAIYKCPLMCSVQTYVNLESESLHVQAPHMKDGLVISLAKAPVCKPLGDVYLSGDPSFGASGTTGADANRWFTDALGVACKLVRKGDEKGENASMRLRAASAGGGVKERSFANEGQLLLVAQASVEDLNSRLPSSSRKTADGQAQAPISGQRTVQMDAARFRPNLVVSGSVAYDEDHWQALIIGDQQFQVTGGCNRCKMINIDQLTGKCPASSEPLVTLASYRRVKGRIYFGILLDQDNASTAGDGAGGGPSGTSPSEVSETATTGRRLRVLEVGQNLNVTTRRAAETGSVAVDAAA